MSIASDLHWAFMMFRARRERRRRLFSGRAKFDDALRPKLSDGVIAYPDAIYHVKSEDLRRAMNSCDLARPTPQDTKEG